MWVRVPPGPAPARRLASRPMKVHELPTPSLLVDVHAFDRNVATMAKRWPGLTLRPHVKAFKSTALAARLAESGPPGVLLRHRAGDDGHGGRRAGRRPAARQREPRPQPAHRRSSRAASPGSPWPSTPRRRSPPPPRPHIPEVLIDVERRPPPLRLRPGRRRPPGRPGPRAGPRGARRHGLRGPPHARARRHQGRPRRAVDGRAARGGRRRWAATSCPAAAPAPGTPTPGSPSCRPAPTA